MMRYAFPQSRASATNNGLLGLTAPPLFENPHNLSLAGSRGRAIQVRAADEFAQTVLPVIRAIQAAGTMNRGWRMASFLTNCAAGFQATFLNALWGLFLTQETSIPLRSRVTGARN